MDIQKLSQQLEAAGQEFCMQIDKIRDMTSVEAMFAELLGNKAIATVHENHLDLSDEEKTVLKKAFRAGLGSLYGSPAWNHCLMKPFGYPGDYYILEGIYTARFPENRSSQVELLDSFGLNMTLPKAVNARKNVLRNWLEKQADNGGGKLLSYACGSAREIRELLPEQLARYEIHLVDRDPRALAYATTHLKTRPQPVNVKTFEADAINGEGLEPVFEQAPYDIVYSFGLFDYLPDDVLITCGRRFVPLLADGGRYLFCLKDCRYYDSWFYEWFFDWKFVPRTIGDGERLADKLGLKILDTFVIESRTVAIFVCASK